MIQYCNDQNHDGFKIKFPDQSNKQCKKFDCETYLYCVNHHLYRGKCYN